MKREREAQKQLQRKQAYKQVSFSSTFICNAVVLLPLLYRLFMSALICHIAS